MCVGTKYEFTTQKIMTMTGTASYLSYQCSPFVLQGIFETKMQHNLSKYYSIMGNQPR